MTDRELLMYDMLVKLSSTNIPLVFKGGLITNLVLQENNYSEVERSTVDIDANWIDSPPTMEELVESVKKAIGNYSDVYDIVPFRDYGEKKSAGLNLIDKANGMKIFSMDIEINPINSTKLYYWGNTTLRGVLPTEIISDKIYSISTDLVYKHRAKDLIDVYMLAHCLSVNTDEIYAICKNKNREISSFNGFIERKNDVEHAYNKLKRIERKPDFSQLYSYMLSFLKPFIEKDFSTQIWNPKNNTWDRLSVLEKKSSKTDPSRSQPKKQATYSVSALKQRAKEIHNTPHRSPTQSKNKKQGLE